MAERLTPDDLAKAHDGLCGVSIGDGPCSCLVRWVEGLQQDVDKLRRERRGFQLMARAMCEGVDPAWWTSLMEEGRYERAAGNAECARCGIVFLDHPEVPGFPTFHMLCDHTIVKT